MFFVNFIVLSDGCIMFEKVEEFDNVLDLYIVLKMCDIWIEYLFVKYWKKDL